MQIILTPEIILAAYSQGLFPMANDAQSNKIQWYCPELRGQLSIDDIHIPKRLKKNLRQIKINNNSYEIRINTNFEHVINACAKQTSTRNETWINKDITDTYCKLHEKGYAHSVECWQDNKIVGGLYGIAIGGAFFGESMFSIVSDASKVSLIHLAARLQRAGFKILDTQFTNSHLEQFGVYEVPYKEYMAQLSTALQLNVHFNFNDIGEAELIKEYLN